MCATVAFNTWLRHLMRPTMLAIGDVVRRVGLRATQLWLGLALHARVGRRGVVRVLWGCDHPTV